MRNLIVLTILFISLFSYGQLDTIALINFDASSNLGYTISSTATTDSVSSSPNFTHPLGDSLVGKAGRGYFISNGLDTLTSNFINTSSYGYVQFSMSLASLSRSSSNGMDIGDSLIVQVFDGTSWSSELKIQGNNNAKWGYYGGVGTAEITYDGDNTTQGFQPSGGGIRTSDGYDSLVIRSLPSVSQLGIRIISRNNSTDEAFAFDDILVSGCNTAQEVTDTAYETTANSAKLYWDNPVCFDSILIHADTIKGLNAPKTASPTSVNSVYSSSGQWVYAGFGEEVTVTNLRNQDTFYFEFYTKAASSWSSGIEVCVIAQFAGLCLAVLDSTYCIDFDSTLKGVNNGQFGGNGLHPIPSSGQLNSYSWAVNGLSDGNSDFEETNTTTPGDFARGSSGGGVTNGGLYAFTISAGNNSFGIQPSTADLTPGDITLKFVNASSSTVDSLLLEYDAYNRNDDGRANSLKVSYSYANSSFISIEPLDYISEITSLSSPYWQQNKRIIHLKKLSLAPDSFFYIKWSFNDVNGSGPRDEFALDNIKLTANPTLSSDTLQIPNTLQSLAIKNVDRRLHSSLTVDHLVLDSAILYLDSANLLVNDTIFTGNEATYVSTNDSGELRLSVEDNRFLHFPVGSNGYSPIDIDLNSTYSSAYVGVDVADSTFYHIDTSSVTDYLQRHWIMSQSGITGSYNFDARAKYRASDVVGNDNMIFGGNWMQKYWDTGPGVDHINDTINFNTNLDSFSVITAAGSPVLPVNLLSFDATLLDGRIELTWVVAQELNIHNYYITKLDDLGYERLLSTVSANGQSNQEISYTTTDFNLEESNHYKLYCTNYDGTAEYLGEQIIEHSKPHLVVIYNVNYISFHKPSDTKITLTNLLGCEMQLIKNNQQALIQKSQLRKGIYIVHLSDKSGTQIESKTFIVY